MEKVTSRGLTLLKDTKLSRRKALAGAAGLGLAAAGATTLTPRRAPFAIGQERQNVVFWTNFTDPDLSVLRNIVQAYNDQMGPYVVELVALPPADETDASRLITAVRGGDGPDVYHMDRFTVASNAAAGLLQPIGEFFDQATRDAYLPFTIAEVTYDGDIYGMPFDTDARALYYNRGKLTAAGVDVAELDPANGPITWDRLVELATPLAVRDAAGLYQQVGFVPWANQGWHYTYGFSWGASFYDEAACAVTPDSPQMIEAMQWVYDTCAAMDPNALSAFQAPREVSGYPPQQGALVTELSAFEITGDWMINQFRQYGPAVDYGVTFLPVPQAGMQSSTWSGGFSMVMPEGARQPEGAVDFIRFITGEQGQRTYTTESRHLPTLTALTTDASLFDEQSSFFATQLLPTSNSRPALAVGARYWDELGDAYQAIYLNSATPAEALATARERTQADLQQYCG